MSWFFAINDSQNPRLCADVNVKPSTQTTDTDRYESSPVSHPTYRTRPPAQPGALESIVGSSLSDV